MQTAGETVYAIWDESVVEKPESIAPEGLCAVRSRKAARLKHIHPGFYNPPGGRPVFVPGMEWLTLLVAGLKGLPVLATMRWWTTRGKGASDRRQQETQLLHRCWGVSVVHLFDRGFASSRWLGQLLRYRLVDACGSRNTWKLTRGIRLLDQLQI